MNISAEGLQFLYATEQVGIFDKPKEEVGWLKGYSIFEISVFYTPIKGVFCSISDYVYGGKTLKRSRGK